MWTTETLGLCRIGAYLKSIIEVLAFSILAGQDRVVNGPKALTIQRRDHEYLCSKSSLPLQAVYC